MDSRGPDYPGSLDRSRLYPSSGTPNATSLLGSSLAEASLSSAARHSALAAADLARAATPVAGSVDPLVAHYQSRYGLPPPPSSLLLHSPPTRGYGSLMSSYLTGNSSSASSASDLSRSLLPGLPPYWTPPHTTPSLSATESYARYAAGLGSSVYPPYVSLLGDSPNPLLLPPHQLPVPLTSHTTSPYHRIHELQKEAYLAGNLGLYSGSSALLSPTSPSASSAVPSDSHLPSRHAEDRDRASPVAPAAGGSSQTRDSTSGNNNSSTSIGSGSSSSKRLDRHSRESFDGKAGGSATFSQSRAHPHATLRSEGHAHPEKGSGGHREREGSLGGHRRSSHLSPEPPSSSGRRDSLEIKRESNDSDRALKDVTTKHGHPLPVDTKIKDEKSDTDTSRLDNGSKKQSDNNGNSQRKEKTVSKKQNEPSEKGSNYKDSSGKTSDEQISSLSVERKEDDSVKAERISPVVTTGANRSVEARGQVSEGKTDTDDQEKQTIQESDDAKDSLNKSFEVESQKGKVTADGKLSPEEESRRKSGDSSSLRSDPIDIRPERDVKESGSPEKMGSEVSVARSSGSSAGATEGSPAGHKDSSKVKQERSPVGSGGSAAGPAKVLTASSGGVVYAMYPAGEDGDKKSSDGDGPYYKMVYSCTPSNRQKSRIVSGRKIHATTYTPEVGTIASTSNTNSSPTSAKTPMKPVKTESVKNNASSGCDNRTSMSPSQSSMTSSNSNSSLSSSGSSKQDSMLSPESGPTTPRSHHRTTGISPESQSSLRRHILGHSSGSNSVKLKDEPGMNRELNRSKDDQAINLSTSPRASELAAKSSDKIPSEKGDRHEERRVSLTSGGRALSIAQGPGQAPLSLPYRDIIHQSQFREHSSAVPLNLVNNTAPSPSLIGAGSSGGSSTEGKDAKESTSTPSRSSSRDSTVSVSRPSAPVNPAADAAGGALTAAPGMLPPWAGLPYGSMGYMLPWDTMMFREQLRSLPEDERRRLIELGYIPPHLLLDAGLDPRYPGSTSWSQNTNPSPVPLIARDNNKTKIKTETSGQDRASTARDRSPLRGDNTTAKPETQGRIMAVPSPRVDIKVDEGQGPSSKGHSQVYTVTAPTIASGGQVIKVDVTAAEHKTQVDIKPFNVVPQPAASNNNNRQSQADEPTSGPNIPVGIAIAQQRADAKGKEKQGSVAAASGSSSSEDSSSTNTENWSQHEQARTRDMLFRQQREHLPTHSQRSRASATTSNSDGGGGLQSESGKDSGRGGDGAPARTFTAAAGGGDSKPTLPVTPPAGFKLMQDPFTGQLFIIPESVMEGVGRMLPSQTGAASRPATVAPMTRPQPQRLEAVVQPQQQQALRHKQKVEAKPSITHTTSRTTESKVNLPQTLAATATHQTVGRVEVAATGAPRVSSEPSPIRGPSVRSPEPVGTVAASGRSRPPPRVILGDKAMTVQAQPMPYIPGLTAPDNLGQAGNPPMGQFPTHLPYLMDSALLQELHQLRQLHAERTSSSTASKCEPSKSVQSRGTSPIVIPDDDEGEASKPSTVKVTTSTSTEVDNELLQEQLPERLSRRQSSTTAVQTSPTVEQQEQQAVHSTLSCTAEQSVQTCTECSQIHQAAQELLSIGSRRNSGSVVDTDIEVQGICAGHALHDTSPNPIIFSPPKSDHSGCISTANRTACRTSHTPISCSTTQQRDLSYLEPELCQVSDGLELLSVLAEHAQKQTHSESESDSVSSKSQKSEQSDRSELESPSLQEKRSTVLARVRGLSNEDDDEPLPMNSPSRLEGYEIPDINKNYNAPKSLLHDKQGGFSGKLFGFRKEAAGLLAETTFKYPDVLDGMDAMELEMRMRLAELQRRYKEKQRELARLTPRRDRDSKTGFLKKSSSPNRQSSSESDSNKKKRKLDSKSEPKKTSTQAPPKAKPNKPETTTPVKKSSSASTPAKGAIPNNANSNLKKKSSSVSENKENAVKTPVKSAKPTATSTATSTPKPAQTPSKTQATGDSKAAKVEEPKTPSSAAKKVAPKVQPKLVPLPDSDSDDIEGVSWVKEDGVKKAPFSNLNKENKSTKQASAPAPKPNWESSSSSSEDSDDSDSDDSSDDSEFHTSSSFNTTGELELSVAAATSAALKSKKRKKNSDETDVKDPDENPVKKRKPGRPKKFGEEEQAGVTETIVAKTTKNFGLMSMKEIGHIKTKAELKGGKPMWDDDWGIRRSERIFLNEPGPTSPTSSKEAQLIPCKLPPSKLPVLKDPTPLLKAASTALALKTKASLKDRPKIREDMDMDPKTIVSTATDSSSDSSSSESEGDDVPLSSLVERPSTPEPKSCVIAKDDLKDNMRVLIFMEGLFYEGEVKEIEPPDIYGVVIDGERGNRPHILSQEELLNQAIFDVKPTSLRYVPEGTRVCAYWSQQYACLYPGTVAPKGADSPETDNTSLINVEFDDGDSAKITMDHIRMLPPNYPVVSQEPQPLLVLGKRRRRTGSEDVFSAEPMRERKFSFGETSQSGDKKKTPSKPLKHVKAPECAKTGVIGEETENKPERGKKDGEKEGSRNRSLSPGKPDKSKSKSTGGTQTMSMSTSTDVPIAKTLPQAPSMASKTFSSIVKKKHKHKDKTKEKCKLKKLGGKHKHKHHHHKKHKAKGKDGLKKTKKLGDSKQNTKKVETEGAKSDSKAAATSTQPASSQAKKEKSAKSESAFSIVPNQNSGESKNGSGSRRSDLTVRIRSNSGDFAHNPFEFHSEDEESSSVAGTSTTQSTCQGESVADMESVTASQKDEESAGEEDEESEEEEQEKEASPAKRARTSNAGGKKRRERSASSDSKSKIAAFLPARQLWRWLGKGTKRPGMKGKAKKEFFKAVTRGKEIIRVGDCAVFLSTGRPNLPYVGRIESLWEAWGGNMVVRTRWFYHPEETRGGKKLAEVKGALYQSPHVDENDVQTISHKCYVLSYTEYRARKAHLNDDNSGIYYLAGTYEPTIGMITFEADVKHH